MQHLFTLAFPEGDGYGNGDNWGGRGCVQKRISCSCRLKASCSASFSVSLSVSALELSTGSWCLITSTVFSSQKVLSPLFFSPSSIRHLSSSLWLLFSWSHISFCNDEDDGSFSGLLWCGLIPFLLRILHFFHDFGFVSIMNRIKCYCFSNGTYYNKTSSSLPTNHHNHLISNDEQKECL